MCPTHQGRFRQQVRFLRRQFLQDAPLPFSGVLSEKIIEQSLSALVGVWKDRIYTPLVTLWVFLGQVLSVDHSCRAAVARLIAQRVSQGLQPCSAETGAYCQARKRLPERFFSDVARHTGTALENEVESQWLWKGRRIYVYDGSTVTMPDTEENQFAYPQPVVQRPGLAIQGHHDDAFREQLYQHMLDAIVTHRVADRPNRFEPRRRKRHAKKYFTFIKTRHEAKRELANGIKDN